MRITQLPLVLLAATSLTLSLSIRSTRRHNENSLSLRDAAADPNVLNGDHTASFNAEVMSYLEKRRGGGGSGGGGGRSGGSSGGGSSGSGSGSGGSSGGGSGGSSGGGSGGGSRSGGSSVLLAVVAAGTRALQGKPAVPRPRNPPKHRDLPRHRNLPRPRNPPKAKSPPNSLPNSNKILTATVTITVPHPPPPLLRRRPIFRRRRNLPLPRRRTVSSRWNRPLCPRRRHRRRSAHLPGTMGLWRLQLPIFASIQLPQPNQRVRTRQQERNTPRDMSVSDVFSVWVRR